MTEITVTEALQYNDLHDRPCVYILLQVMELQKAPSGQQNIRESCNRMEFVIEYMTGSILYDKLSYMTDNVKE